MVKLSIIKRSGEEVAFDKKKISNAIAKANYTVSPKERLKLNEIESISESVFNQCKNKDRQVSVEDIQNMVEDELLDVNTKVAKRYIKYRENSKSAREDSRLLDSVRALINDTNQDVQSENANKAAELVSTKRDLIAGEVCKVIGREDIIPEDVMAAHDKGLIHFHDLDYFAQDMSNCCLVNLEDMFENGTVISNVMIETPKSFKVAANIMTQIISQVASSQYGGQTVSLSHLAPYVDVSRKKIKAKLLEELKGVNVSKDRINSIVEDRVRREIRDAVQLIQYEINTNLTTNGQTPFVTVFMYLGETEDKQTKDDLAMIIEETIKQRIQGVKNEVGAWITPAFPKLIYVLEEDNIHEDSEYYYLTELSAECTAKRMVPDYISEKIMKQSKIDENGDGQCYPTMGCRATLTPYVDEDSNPKYYGRWNQGVVTLNLPYVALSAYGDEDVFWKKFDEALNIAYKGLMVRHNHLKGIESDAAPILWQHGAISRLETGETIDDMLYNGYTTISLGFAGLYECTQAMKGSSHTDPEGKEFALEVMQYMNDKVAEWKEKENIEFSLYGTPLESSTYKLARALQDDFGKIENVSDRNYITNSYHVHVTEEIDAFTKLKFESEFQALAPGGAISYVETSDLTNNTDAVISIMKFMYDNILYAELNSKSDYCQECAYEGEIAMIRDESNKLIYECPNCLNRNRRTMNIARRMCGYIGVNESNAGRNEDINDRIEHTSVPTRALMGDSVEDPTVRDL